MGAALIAFMLRAAGLPFLKTWAVLSAVVIAAGAALALWQNRRPKQ